MAVGKDRPTDLGRWAYDALPPKCKGKRDFYPCASFTFTVRVAVMVGSAL